MHRQLLPQKDYVFEPSKPIVLGNYPLLFFTKLGTTTNADLYHLVWEQVRRYARSPDTPADPLAAHGIAKEVVDVSTSETQVLASPPQRQSEQIMTLEQATPQLSQHLKQEEDSSSAPRPEEEQTTFVSIAGYHSDSVPDLLTASPDSQQTSHNLSGSSKLIPPSARKKGVPHAERSASQSQQSRKEARTPTSSAPPFLLKRVTTRGGAGGEVCSVCEWHRRCTGCVIECDTELLAVKMDDVVAIEWQEEYIKNGHLDMTLLDQIWDHPSVELNRAKLNRPVSFSDCMELFTRSEQMTGDSQVYCSQCKTHQDATKKMELWSTPPVLIVHLKRLLPGRKLYTLVSAPTRGFDPSPFFAPTRAAAVSLHHTTALESHSTPIASPVHGRGVVAPATPISPAALARTSVGRPELFHLSHLHHHLLPLPLLLLLRPRFLLSHRHLLLLRHHPLLFTLIQSSVGFVLFIFSNIISGRRIGRSCRRCY
eukprot:gb/GEZN01000867.1/.p1 GENE.gb/GEZN01000867.1/~~gb/GEZN01000867.1/.p1  ORF type:complete len:482 (-),score=76.98 gb/GEZN01000867.1/:1704-3149(-)